MSEERKKNTSTLRSKYSRILVNPHTNIEKKLTFLNMRGPRGPQEGYQCNISGPLDIKTTLL